MVPAESFSATVIWTTLNRTSGLFAITAIVVVAFATTLPFWASLLGGKFFATTLTGVQLDEGRMEAGHTALGTAFRQWFAAVDTEVLPFL